MQDSVALRNLPKMSCTLMWESLRFCWIFTFHAVRILGQSQPLPPEGRMAIWLPTNPSAMLYGEWAFPLWEKKREGGRVPIKRRRRDQVTLLVWHLQILGTVKSPYPLSAPWWLFSGSRNVSKKMFFLRIG